MDGSAQAYGAPRGSSASSTTTGSNPASTVSTSHLDAPWPHNPPLSQPRSLERPSFGNIRASFRGTASAAGSTIAAIAQNTVVRAVTPEPTPSPPPSESFAASNNVASPRSHTIPSSPKRHGYVSPRIGVSSATGVGLPRRKPVPDDESPSRTLNPPPPPPPQRQQQQQQLLTQPYNRPRNRTMDAASLRQHMASGLPSMALSPNENRHRVGSVSSSGSQGYHDDARSPPSQYDHTFPNRPLETPPPAPPKDKEVKKSKRQPKRTNSRPSSPSPVMNYPPYVDSLPFPLPTEDATKVLLLMRNLRGRMRGEIEYQIEIGTTWVGGLGYIDEERGALMLDPGQNSPFHTNLIPDLRGCQVMPVTYSGCDQPVLELSCAHPQIEILIRPVAWEEMDLWTAALLCWQQLRPASIKLSNRRPAAPTPLRRELKRFALTPPDLPPRTSIIKMGNILLWDKGLPLTPRTVVRRSSTRDHRSPACAWRRIPCTLHENGEFRLLSDIDGSILTLINLSQFSRCAVQNLDRTVLGEEHCIGIFPIYHPTSTELSVFRPIFLSLDSREHFEVWFVLLRAFALPEIFRVDPTKEEQVVEIDDLDGECNGEVFRIEKSINVRITEAKLTPRSEAPPVPDRTKPYQDVNNNYMAEVLLDGEIRSKTTTKAATKNPFWRDESEFVDLPPLSPFYLSVLLKRVEGYVDGVTNQAQTATGTPRLESSTREVVCGAVDIPLDRLENGKDHEQWLQIYDQRQNSIGTMLVKIHHDELVVLVANEYSALSELLHRFPAGLTNMIATAVPGQLRRLSEIFLNIFQVTRSAGDWLMTLVEDEIDGINCQSSTKKFRFNSRLKSCESIDSSGEREAIVRDMGKSLTGEANLLFRGNSLLTQSLEFHMRRLGKEYLDDALRDKLHEINEINPDCEVDPSRVQSGDDIPLHWSLLLQLTTDVWQCIVGSVDRIPNELRQVLRFIRAVAEDRYGDFLRTVAYTAVSGFIFLRFVCPAILSPKLFGLLRDHPQPRAQRTFTIIAKSLQKLANLSTFGKREEWMEPMNRFLNSHRSSFREYIDNVCSVPVDGLGASVAMPAQYSAPVTVLGRLSPIRREGFPSLPYLIDHSRSFAALVKVWTDANPLASTPVGGSGSTAALDPDSDLRIFNDMCLNIQRRADECLARVEALRSAAEGSSMSAVSSTALNSIDEASESLARSSCGEHVGGLASFASSTTPSWVDMYGANEESPGPPGSSGSEDAMGISAGSHPDAARGTKDARSRTRAQSAAVGTTTTTISGPPPGTVRLNKAHGGARATRMILSGIMRMAARPSSPDRGNSSASRPK